MGKVTLPYRPQEEDLIAEWEVDAAHIMEIVGRLLDKPVPHFNGALISATIRDVHRETAALLAFVRGAKQREEDRANADTSDTV